MSRRLIVLAMTTSVAAVYLLRLDDIGGLYKDDAYYMVLAKALAQGDGFALISSAAAPILPAFPPGFPLLLAPVFAVWPVYPDNLPWLKLISIVAMVGAGVLTFQYLARYRGVTPGKAATIALLTALTPGFVFLATSTVMAECAFTFALMASAVAIERAGASESRRSLLVAGVIVTAALLIRSAGVALVVAGAAFLLGKRGWRAAAGFGMMCAVAYLPWMSYAAAHTPTPEEREAHGGAAAQTYSALLQTRSGGDGVIGLDEVPKRVLQNIKNVFAHDMGAVIFPAGYRDAVESGTEVFMLSGETGLRAGSMGLGAPVMVLSTGVSLLVLLGAVVMARRGAGVAEFVCICTLAMVVLLPARTYRYVLPITPFLISYFLTGVEALSARLRAGSEPSAFRITAALLLFFLAAEHGRYVWQKLTGPPPPWIQDGREVRLVTDFVNLHVPPGSPAVSTNPALLYLLTGHKAVAYVDPLMRWSQWRESGYRYAVALHAVEKPADSLGSRLLYETPKLRLWVVDFGSGPR